MFDGRAIRMLADRIGGRLLTFVDWSGGVAIMLAQALARGPRRPIGMQDIVEQIKLLGIRSLPLTALMSAFVGMILAWQFGDALEDFGAKNALGNVTSLALVQELVPVLLAVTVGTKMATGMTAELGSMKVTEQIDAIGALGADPIKKLVWPRIVAASVAMPLLVALGNVLAMLGGMVIADFVFDVPGNYFYSTFIEELEPLDYFTSLSKALTFGMLTGLMGCYEGFNTGFGTEAVGMATTQTVATLSISVLIADFALTAVFIPV
jgi:phospholipid/cholesterol/gamma-HCH transport system permease protein